VKIRIGIALLVIGSKAFSQIPVEVFGGHKKTTFDVLFFRYFKNQQNENSKFLFFNRNRASLDYRQTSTTYLPAFGFTEALSYNPSRLKGFAPVVVIQILSNGITPKAGMQYFHRKGEFTFFSWAVYETIKAPNVDLFVLTRFEPKLTEKWHLFTQLELINTFPTVKENNFNFIQRVRVGLTFQQRWQSGLAGDFGENGRSVFMTTQNIGLFLRKEF
jgi:hypothetical protein